MAIQVKIKSFTPKQREIATDIISSVGVKYFIVNAGRQSSKSYLLERLSFYFLSKERSKLGAFIMANEKQLKARFRSMLSWLPKRVIKSSNKAAGNMEIQFVNGSTLMFYTAGSPDGIASNSFDYMFCDEFALWSEYAWSIIRPCVAAKREAKVIAVSTPRGKNHHYKYYTMGLDPEFKRYKSYSMSYPDNPFYDLDDVEEARRSMPDALFKQEYEGQFITGFGSVFGKFSKNQTVREFNQGIYTGQAFFGIDVSGTGDDSTILTILDAKGKTLEIYQCETTAMPDQADEICPVLAKYENIRGYVETNGLGIGLYDILCRNGVIVEGLNSENNMKQTLVTEIVTDIKANTVQFPTADLYPKLDNEMSIYVAKRTATGKLTYSHPTGMHDDAVDSFMIANHARHELGDQSYTVDGLDYSSCRTSRLKY